MKTNLLTRKRGLIEEAEDVLDVVALLEEEFVEVLLGRVGQDHARDGVEEKIGKRN